MRAAAALGPKTATPACRSSSATPATSGASGPTTTRSMSERLGEREEPLAVLGAHRMAGAERGDAGVPGRRVQLAEPRALRELPRERVLAAAGADEEHVHGGESRRATSSTAPARRGRGRGLCVGGWRVKFGLMTIVHNRAAGDAATALRSLRRARDRRRAAPVLAIRVAAESDFGDIERPAVRCPGATTTSSADVETCIERVEFVAARARRRLPGVQRRLGPRCRTSRPSPRCDAPRRTDAALPRRRPARTVTRRGTRAVVPSSGGAACAVAKGVIPRRSASRSVAVIGMPIGVSGGWITPWPASGNSSTTAVSSAGEAPRRAAIACAASYDAPAGVGVSAREQDRTPHPLGRDRRRPGARRRRPEERRAYGVGLPRMSTLDRRNRGGRGVLRATSLGELAITPWASRGSARRARAPPRCREMRRRRRSAGGRRRADARASECFRDSTRAGRSRGCAALLAHGRSRAGAREAVRCDSSPGIGAEAACPIYELPQRRSTPAWLRLRAKTRPANPSRRTSRTPRRLPAGPGRPREVRWRDQTSSGEHADPEAKRVLADDVPVRRSSCSGRGTGSHRLDQAHRVQARAAAAERRSAGEVDDTATVGAEARGRPPRHPGGIDRPQHDRDRSRSQAAHDHANALIDERGARKGRSPPRQDAPRRRRNIRHARGSHPCALDRAKLAVGRRVGTTGPRRPRRRWQPTARWQPRRRACRARRPTRRPGSRSSACRAARRARPARRRGAARDPDQRPRRSRSRCGRPGTTRSSRSASASRRACAPRRRGAPGRPRRERRRGRRARASTRRGSSAASTRRPPAASAARARSRRSRSRRRGSRAGSASRAALLAALPDRLRARAGRVRRDRRPARDRALRRRRRAALPARGRRPAQRDGQGRRLGVPRRAAAARASVLCVSGRLSFELVQKAAVAGCPVLVAVGAPSSLAVELARDRGSRSAASSATGALNVYTEPWRIAELTGVLLVGGASSALRLAEGARPARRRDARRARVARARRGVRRAARGRQGRGRAAAAVPAAGRRRRDVRAPIAGVVAGLRAAPTDVSVFLPVDCPWIEPRDAAALGSRAPRRRVDAAVPPTGPLPGAYAGARCRCSSAPRRGRALAARRARGARRADGRGGPERAARTSTGPRSSPAARRLRDERRAARRARARARRRCRRADLDVELVLDELDVARAPRPGGSSSVVDVVERLAPARAASRRPARQWWKSLWCAGNSSVSRAVAAAGSACRPGISANAERTSSFVSASEVIPLSAHRVAQRDEVEPAAAALAAR